MSAPTRVVVADANILINLCHAASLHLLERLPGYDFIVSSEVDAEVTNPDQRRQLDEVFGRGALRREALASMSELSVFAELRARMGSGEASCIAMAQVRHLHIASDERGIFLREAAARIGAKKVLTTPWLFVLAIRAGLMTVATADAAKHLLERHRFTMRFASFGDVLGDKG